MSKLYLSASTDMIKTIHTARANRWIDLLLGYDESRVDRKINIRLNIPEDTKKPTLWVEGQKICEIDLEKNFMTCKLEKLEKRI